MLCASKNLFGIPGKGAHLFRLGGVAVVDLLLTLLLSVGLSYIPHSPPCTLWIVFLLLVSMTVHKMFCVTTSANAWLNTNDNLAVFVVVSILLLLSLAVLKN